MVVRTLVSQQEGPGFSGFPPTVQKHTIRLTGESKLRVHIGIALYTVYVAL